MTGQTMKALPSQLLTARTAAWPSIQATPTRPASLQFTGQNTDVSPSGYVCYEEFIAGAGVVFSPQHRLFLEAGDSRALKKAEIGARARGGMIQA